MLLAGPPGQLHGVDLLGRQSHGELQALAHEAQPGLDVHVKRLCPLATYLNRLAGSIDILLRERRRELASCCARELASCCARELAGAAAWERSSINAARPRAGNPAGLRSAGLSGDSLMATHMQDSPHPISCLEPDGAALPQQLRARSCPSSATLHPHHFGFNS